MRGRGHTDEPCVGDDRVRVHGHVIDVVGDVEVRELLHVDAAARGHTVIHEGKVLTVGDGKAPDARGGKLGHGGQVGVGGHVELLRRGSRGVRE